MNQYIVGDCIEVMRGLPAESVQCCVTSPPYWGLRDYGHPGQLGLEKKPDEYVAKMVDVFREVKRLLKPDGVLWLNLGDTYAGSWGNHGARAGEQREKKAVKYERHAWDDHIQRPPMSHDCPGLKPKDLVGIPWRVAFALQSDGWWLRSDIIWSKPNPMPESVTDRPTKAHEYIFLLAKSARYYYDHEAVKQPAVRPHEVGNLGGSKGRNIVLYPGDPNYRGENGSQWGRAVSTGDRVNLRSVWEITTQPYPDAHFAVFPERLPKLCILAGSRVGDTILDPFGGSGTTGKVAEDLGRDWILIDVNDKYKKLADKRTAQTGMRL